MSNLKNQFSLNDETTTGFDQSSTLNKNKSRTTTQSESNIPTMSTSAGMLKQKQMGGGGGGGGTGSEESNAKVSSPPMALRSVSTSATLANNNINNNKNFNSSGFSNRSNSGSSSVNARLNMMGTSRRDHGQSRREEFEIYYQKCLKGLSHSINIIKATTMRLVFSLHSFIAIIYVYYVRQDEWYFLNFIGVVFLLIELFITIIKRKGKEPRWFFPCFFIYICTMIPPIWFVELSRIEKSNLYRNKNSSTTTTSSLENQETALELEDLPLELLSNAKNIDKLDIATIAVGLEITLLMLVILGRWFLPKGNISRSTLSQLLLVYMSLASDIVDLLSLLNEKQVQESATMSYFTLTIFSWSLFQFSLNLVVTRGRSFQSVAVDDLDGEGGGGTTNNEQMPDDDQLDSGRTFIEKLNMFAQNVKPDSPKAKNFLCISSKIFRFDLFDSEIWSILITLIFQDGPFLALRLTAVIKFDVRTFVTMFFTCKNAIILFLQFYRLSAICNEANNNQNDPLVNNKADALASLNTAATFLDKFVCLSYAQNTMIKNNNRNKFSTANLEESEKRLLSINPILLRSTLSRNHSYAVVLTPNYNLNVSCCQCDCHPKDTTYM